MSSCCGIDTQAQIDSAQRKLLDSFSSQCGDVFR